MRTCLFALSLAPAVPALAADGPPDQSLAMFDRLAGKCFVASIGPGASDTHCFEKVFGGKHVRDRHVVTIDGKAAYRGETIYSHAAAEVEFTYINSLGGVGQGKARATASGIDFTGSMRAAPANDPQSMDSKWLWQPSGGYQASDSAGKPVTFRPVPAKRR
ncbi:hypothetical protein [Novosphingobium sp. TH158]|uniref:hypothetical protein n=1 Tax=Novosphingobium sp. TH158 TaxID=2067455 RepID=UPI000C7CCB56|nr:hypothetical protein [Novosphingobium sp. TH158]PLK24371.1 hypothetical protein C0V78_14025 [Novosphingobium sp. TH158]